MPLNDSTLERLTFLRFIWISFWIAFCLKNQRNLKNPIVLWIALWIPITPYCLDTKCPALWQCTIFCANKAIACIAGIIPAPTFFVGVNQMDHRFLQLLQFFDHPQLLKTSLCPYSKLPNDWFHLYANTSSCESFDKWIKADQHLIKLLELRIIITNSLFDLCWTYNYNIQRLNDYIF